MSKVVIFGAGKIADEAYFYLTNDSPNEVVAFAVDREHLNVPEKLGLPVVAFEDVVQLIRQTISRCSLPSATRI